MMRAGREVVMKKVELLAPAGNYESFLGAINAGADAVYLGGEKFGARAFADNFSNEELIRAIRYAHLFDKKVYLTVNTLMREEEMRELTGYLTPLYQSGLDAVIVQDLGVVEKLRHHFPQLELHISTQMTITGPYGAKLMKRCGASRIVPARELSLEEIREIKQQADIEVETFIHGALCYCYSGQCLFSSVLGKRSGNRGRCAQPCRLPYGNDHLYPLSLKDLCTVEMIPQMIEAGIDSFKIEGRMKKPEYAAGVTAIYRKYIDRYYERPNVPFTVEASDLTFLRQLYVRSELQDGYYYRHNGREMITLDKPSYAGSSDELLQWIKSSYLDQPKCLPVKGRAVLQKDRPILFCVQVRDDPEKQVTTYGEIAQKAQKRPLEKDSVEKQLSKMGATPFVLDSLQIEMEEDVFLPLKAVNELRRSALEQLEQQLISGRNRTGQDREIPAVIEPATAAEDQVCRMFAGVLSMEQFFAVCQNHALAGIYLPVDCLLGADAPAASMVAAWKDCVQEKQRNNPSFACYLVMPYVIRKRDQAYLAQIKPLLQEPETAGILIRNLESYEWLLEQNINKPLVTDANLYIWNKDAARFIEKLAEQDGRCVRMTLPIEAHRQQLRALAGHNKELIVYGRIPMMISANCIRNTTAHCLLQEKQEAGQKQKFYELKDRYRKKFPVCCDCRHCMNVIYNSLPTSLHQELPHIKEWKLGGVRLNFTTEEADEAAAVTDYFAGILSGQDKGGRPPFLEATKGHFKNGAK